MTRGCKHPALVVTHRHWRRRVGNEIWFVGGWSQQRGTLSMARQRWTEFFCAATVTGEAQETHLKHGN